MLCIREMRVVKQLSWPYKDYKSETMISDTQTVLWQKKKAKCASAVIWWNHRVLSSQCILRAKNEYCLYCHVSIILITMFLNWCRQCWAIYAVFNSPPPLPLPLKEITRCNVWWMGCPRDKIVASICNMPNPVLWKNMNEKQSHIPMKMNEGGSSSCTMKLS